MISIKYVSGDTTEYGTDSIGTKGALIKMSGNLTITVKIWVVEGLSDGGTDKITLKQENANAPTNIPRIIIKILVKFQIERTIIPIIRGKQEKNVPKKNEPQTSPNNIVLIETGHVISLSSVFCLVSHGNTIGATEVAVKKIISANNPDIT